MTATCKPPTSSIGSTLDSALCQCPLNQFVNSYHPEHEASTLQDNDISDPAKCCAMLTSTFFVLRTPDLTDAPLTTTVLLRDSEDQITKLVLGCDRSLTPIQPNWLVTAFSQPYKALIVEMQSNTQSFFDNLSPNTASLVGPLRHELDSSLGPGSVYLVPAHRGLCQSLVSASLDLRLHTRRSRFPTVILFLTQILTIRVRTMLSVCHAPWFQVHV